MQIIEVDIAEFFSDAQHLAALVRLAEENRAEVENHVAKVMSLNLAGYAQLQAQGMLIALVALDDDLHMVGYACALIAPNLHYGYLMAVNDAVFVSKLCRSKGYGLRLIREVQRIAKERGAQMMVWQAKMGSSLNKVLKHLGYKMEEVVYLKEI